MDRFQDGNARSPRPRRSARHARRASRCTPPCAVMMAKTGTPPPRCRARREACLPRRGGGGGGGGGTQLLPRSRCLPACLPACCHCVPDAAASKRLQQRLTAHVDACRAAICHQGIPGQIRTNSCDQQRCAERHPGRQGAPASLPELRTDPARNTGQPSGIRTCGSACREALSTDTTLQL
jgi:hypothetical protein